MSLGSLGYDRYMETLDKLTTALARADAAEQRVEAMSEVLFYSSEWTDYKKTQRIALERLTSVPPSNWVRREEVDKLRAHAEAMAEALDRVTSETAHEVRDAATEFAGSSLTAYRAAFPKPEGGA